ncbi:hypothetical protein RM844_21190 [Streptomyces sp. DSM 44915]|uniref:Membrane protein YczE n=1 Tax=Streptomyces chisholmiae TaxID=3075540 RepID=A0ABU2JVL6_9ACTN|nr:hypothetical protein [Streptomyces sp. DSM 44915]MDT0268806.1 hypothetical protein [Streptomyces sp. DSM 44915]
MNHLSRRLVRLALGLLLFGVSAGLLIEAGLGTGPWDVFHQGVSGHTGLSVGVVVNITGLLVLALWLPLRERPGFGTFANALLVGLGIDATLALTPTPAGPAVQLPLMLAAVVLNGLATGLYLSARLGAGPRDGLMTGLARVTGRSLRLARTGVEVAVLLLGVVLGGTVGVGTVVYAVAIGPLAQFFLRVLAAPEAVADAGPGPGRDATSDTSADAVPRMDFEDRPRRGILRPWSRRMDRDHEPSSVDAG